MAEWTAERRAKMYELIGEADLAGLRKLAHEHPHLRPSDLTPIEKKALLAFGDCVANDPQLQNALLEMLEDPKGSAGLIAAHTFRGIKDFPDEHFTERFRELIANLYPRVKKENVDRIRRMRWPPELVERALKYLESNGFQLAPEDNRRVSAFMIAACNAPTLAKADCVLEKLFVPPGETEPREFRISSPLLFGAANRRIALWSWRAEREKLSKEASGQATGADGTMRAPAKSKSLRPAEAIREALAGSSIDEILNSARSHPRLTEKQLKLELVADSLWAWAARTAADERLQDLLLNALVGESETAHLLARSILRLVPQLEHGRYTQAFVALLKRLETHGWASFDQEPMHHRLAALFEISLGLDPISAIQKWASGPRSKDLRKWCAGVLAFSLGSKIGFSEAERLLDPLVETERAGYLGMEKPWQKEPFWDHLREYLKRERMRIDPFYAITGFQTSLIGWQAQWDPLSYLVHQTVTLTWGPDLQAFLDPYKPIISTCKSLGEIRREAPDFFLSLFARTPIGELGMLPSLARYLAEVLRDVPDFEADIAMYLVACLEANTSLDIDWAFRSAFENPRRLAPSGRTLFDLVKVGLWGMNQSTARDSIRRFQAMAHAGYCAPEEAFDAIEEVFTMESPALWSAAAKALAEMREAHPELRLKRPDRIQEIIARDPKKYARIFKPIAPTR